MGDDDFSYFWDEGAEARSRNRGHLGLDYGSEGVLGGMEMGSWLVFCAGSRYERFLCIVSREIVFQESRYTLNCVFWHATNSKVP